MQFSKPLRRTKAKRRSGIAVVELAICLPILVMMMLATAEACTMIYLRQKLKISAYEGARVGITPESTASNVSYHCETLLDSQSVQSYTITMTPSDPSTLAPGEFFQCTISAPCNANSLIGGWIYNAHTLSESVSLPSD